MKDETVWLNKSQLAELFQTDRSSIAKHIQNIYETHELYEDSICAKIVQVQKELLNYWAFWKQYKTQILNPSNSTGLKMKLHLQIINANKHKTS